MGDHIIKVCGITTIDDAEMTLAAGATTIGLNIWPSSPRSVAVETAAKISAATRDRLEIVLVTVNMAWAELMDACRVIRPHWVQLHGDEPDAWVDAIHMATGVPTYRAIGLGDAKDVQRALNASGPRVLIDACDDVQRGGTGRALSQSLAHEVCAQRPTILAGGLGPDNVADAIAACQPMGVDAASRLEMRDDRRRKDPEKVAAFVRAARDSFARCDISNGAIPSE